MMVLLFENEGPAMASAFRDAGAFAGCDPEWIAATGLLCLAQRSVADATCGRECNPPSPNAALRRGAESLSAVNDA